MAMAFALALGEADTNPTTPEVTGIWTPTPNKVYCCFQLISTAATFLSMTGNGLTWIPANNAVRAGNCTMYSSYAIADGSVFAGASTISFTGTPTGIITQIVEVSGDIDVVTPVVQSPTNNGPGATSSSLTFAAFGDPVNNGILFAAALTGQTAISSADGTQLSDLGHATPTREQSPFWNIGQDLSAVCSFASNAWMSLGFELAYKLATPASTDSIGMPALMGHGYW